MLIESIIQRPKGTTISLGTGPTAAEYHFRPDGDGRHMCEVADQAHAALLLAIRDGFRSASPGDALALTAAAHVTNEIEGPYFVFRGPQDLEAFQHWALAIPDLTAPVAEFVLLIDKIAIGEASLGGYTAPTELPVVPFGSHRGTLPAGVLSPRPPADNTILPSDRSQHDEADAARGVGSSAGDGGAGAAGGAGAEQDDGSSKSAGTRSEGDAGDGDNDDAGAGDREPPPPPPPATLDREGLAKEYDELFGHRPNGKWQADKIAAAIAEKKAAG